MYIHSTFEEVGTSSITYVGPVVEAGGGIDKILQQENKTHIYPW
jgi:hypothetical protein